MHDTLMGDRVASTASSIELSVLERAKNFVRTLPAWPRVKRWLLADTNLARAIYYLCFRLPHVVVSRLNAKRVNHVIMKCAHDRGKSQRFIVIGANDGISNDPLAEGILRGGWAGIMIEPHPIAFAALQKNFGHNKNICLLNVAISDSAGSFDLFYYADNLKLSSLNRTSLEKNLALIGLDASVIQSHKVPCITFDEALQLGRLTGVDIISIDTEGNDYRVLKSIDLRSYKPHMIHYEEAHLSRDEKRLLHSELRGLGYRTLSYWGDVLAYKAG